PLAYSFSEAHQDKFVVLLEASVDKPLQIHKIKLEQGRPLYKQSFESLNACIDWLKEHQECLVELTIATDTFFTPAEIKQLYEVHDGIIFIIPKVKTIVTQAGVQYKETVD